MSAPPRLDSETEFFLTTVYCLWQGIVEGNQEQIWAKVSPWRTPAWILKISVSRCLER